MPLRQPLCTVLKPYDTFTQRSYAESELKKYAKQCDRQTHVFESYRANYHLWSSDDDVIDILKKRLRLAIRVDMVTIYEKDEAMLNMIINCAEGIMEAVDKDGNRKDLLSHCKYPLYAGVVCLFVLKKCRSLFRRRRHDELLAFFEAAHRCLDTRMYNLLDELYKENASSAFLALETNYESAFTSDHLDTPIELMKIAYYGKATASFGDKERNISSGNATSVVNEQTRPVTCIEDKNTPDISRFLSHVACQRMVQYRWGGGFIIRKFAHFLHLVFFFWRRSHNKLRAEDSLVMLQTKQKKKNTSTIRWKRDRKESTVTPDAEIKTKPSSYFTMILSPLVKYYYFLMCQLFYLFIYARVLLLKPGLYYVKKSRNDGWRVRLGVYWSEILVVCVQICLLEETVLELAQTKVMEPFRFRRYQFRIWTSLVILANFTFAILAYSSQQISESYPPELPPLHYPFSHNPAMEFTTVETIQYFATTYNPKEDEPPVFSQINATISELLFNVSFVLATISFLRFLGKNYFFGSVVKVLQKSFQLVVKYLVMFIIFWVVYAVLVLSLTEEYNDKDEWTGWIISQTGMFEIFGEVTNSNNSEGVLSRCAPVTIKQMMNGTTGTEHLRCLVRSSILPFVLFIYMIVASIMLVNLLTAMLSKEYEDIRDESRALWKFDNYRLLVDFESKSWMPPPFVFLVYTARLIGFAWLFLVQTWKKMTTKYNLHYMLSQMFVSAAVITPVRDFPVTVDFLGKIASAKLLSKETAVSAAAVYSNIRILEHSLKKSQQSLEEVLAAVNKPLIAKISEFYSDFELALTEPLRVIGAELPQSETDIDPADLQERKRRFASLVGNVKEIIQEFWDTSSDVEAPETSTLIPIEEGNRLMDTETPKRKALLDLLSHCDTAEFGLEAIVKSEQEISDIRKNFDVLNSYFSSADITAAKAFVQTMPVTEWSTVASIENIEKHLLSSKPLPKGGLTGIAVTHVKADSDDYDRVNKRTIEIIKMCSHSNIAEYPCEGHTSDLENLSRSSVEPTIVEIRSNASAQIACQSIRFTSAGRYCGASCLLWCLFHIPVGKTIANIETKPYLRKLYYSNRRLTQSIDKMVHLLFPGLCTSPISSSRLLKAFGATLPKHVNEKIGLVQRQTMSCSICKQDWSVMELHIVLAGEPNGSESIEQTLVRLSEPRALNYCKLCKSTNGEGQIVTEFDASKTEVLPVAIDANGSSWQYSEGMDVVKFAGMEWILECAVQPHPNGTCSSHQRAWIRERLGSDFRWAVLDDLTDVVEQFETIPEGTTFSLMFYVGAA